MSVGFPGAVVLTAAAGAFAVDGGPNVRFATLRKLTAAKGSIQVSGRAAAIPGETHASGGLTAINLGLSVGF